MWKNKVLEKLNSEGLRIYLICFFIFFAVFALFLNQTFNADFMPTLSGSAAEMRNASEYILGILAGGRITAFFFIPFEKLLGIIGITFVQGKFVYALIEIALLSLAAWILYRVFAEYLSRSVTLLICVLVGILCPPFVEIFSFIGPEHAAAYVMTACALRLFQKKKYLPCFVLVLLAVGTYQTYYAPFLIYTTGLLFIREEGKWKKESFLEWLKALAMTAGGTAVIFICQKAGSILLAAEEVKPTSVAVGPEFMDRIIRIIQRYGFQLLNGGGVLPMGFLIAFVAILFPFLLVAIYRRAKVGGILLFLTGGIFILILPPAFSLIMSEPYLPTRTMVGIYVGSSMYFLICCRFLLPEQTGKPSFRETGFRCFMLIFSFVWIACIETASSNILSANTLERSIVRQVQNEIEFYESETGETIQKVATVHYREDAQPVFDKANFRYFWKLDYSQHLLLYTAWSDVSTLNYFTGENYEKLEMTKEEEERFFGGIDKESFVTFNPHTQLVFEGDTAYWALY